MQPLPQRAVHRIESEGSVGLSWKSEVSERAPRHNIACLPFSYPSQSMFESLLLDPSIANFFGSHCCNKYLGLNLTFVERKAVK